MTYFRRRTKRKENHLVLRDHGQDQGKDLSLDKEIDHPGETEVNHHLQEGEEDIDLEQDQDQGHLTMTTEDSSIKVEEEAPIEATTTAKITLQEEVKKASIPAIEVTTIGEDLAKEIIASTNLGVLLLILVHPQEIGALLKNRRKSIHILKRERLTSTKMARKYFGMVFNG
jgi:hypothetical protein